MTTDQTPGGLLRQARERGGLSARRAAGRANVSEALWRQTELGYRAVAKGVRVPVNTGPERLRRMAEAVNADVASVLAAAGFDASDIPASGDGSVPDAAYRLLALVDGLPPTQSDLWFKLARSIADVLATLSTGTESDPLRISGGSHPSGGLIPTVSTERVQLSPDIGAVLGRLGEAAASSPELRDELATFSEDLFRRYGEEQTNG